MIARGSVVVPRTWPLVVGVVGFFIMGILGGPRPRSFGCFGSKGSDSDRDMQPADV